MTHTRLFSDGSWKTVAPLEPWAERFSAPFVPNTWRKRSTSSTVVVARSMAIPFGSADAHRSRSACVALSGGTGFATSVELPSCRMGMGHRDASAGDGALDHPVLDGPAGRCGPVVDADLRVDVRDVVLGGALRDEELGRDLVRRLAVREQSEHLDLPPAQPARALVGRRSG